MKTGPVKIVAALGKLKGICNDLGDRYNPSKAALTIAAIDALQGDAQNSIEAVNVARANLVLAINSRQEKFARINPLVSRVVRALAACESSVENIKDARLIKRKMLARPAVKGAVATVPVSEGSTPKISHTTSRLDFDGKADTFAQLLQLLQGIPAYAPNEAELQLVALKATLTDLQNANGTVANAGNALVNARINRNKVMLGSGGVHDTGTAVKEYLRSVFGVRSETTKELGKLRFAA